jgi:hypothetical protein
MSARKRDERNKEKPAGRLASGAAGEKIPEEVLREANDLLLSVTDKIAKYSVIYSSRDRQRLKGNGIKSQGFIQAVFEYAERYPEFFPEGIPINKFRQDVELSSLAKAFLEACDSLRLYAWNLSIAASDAAYADARSYYRIVRKEAKLGKSGVENIYRDLETFFKAMGARSGGLDQKKVERDAAALLSGEKDGVVIIKNARPKPSGGGREVIDASGTGGEGKKDVTRGRKDPKAL